MLAFLVLDAWVTCLCDIVTPWQFIYLKCVCAFIDACNVCIRKFSPTPPYTSFLLATWFPSLFKNSNFMLLTWLSHPLSWKLNTSFALLTWLSHPLFWKLNTSFALLTWLSHPLSWKLNICVADMAIPPTLLKTEHFICDADMAIPPTLLKTGHIICVADMAIPPTLLKTEHFICIAHVAVPLNWSPPPLQPPFPHSTSLFTAFQKFDQRKTENTLSAFRMEVIWDYPDPYTWHGSDSVTRNRTVCVPGVRTWSQLVIHL